jgi:hypothetical protein
MPVPELEKFREKYPQYGDISDTDLANKLATKYPEAYGDLPSKVGGAEPATGGDEPATMTKSAAPAEEPRPRGFFAHLANETTQGLKQMATTEPVGGTGEGGFLPQFNLPTAENVVGGAMRAFPAMSIPAAAGKSLADATGGNLAEYLAPKIGANAAAAIGTAIGTPIEAAVSVFGSQTALQGTGALLAKIKNVIGKKALYSPGVAFARRQTAVATAQKLPDSILPPVPSSQLYDQLGQTNPAIPLADLKPFLKKVGADEALVAGTGLEIPQTTSLVKNLNQKYFTGSTQAIVTPGQGVTGIKQIPGKGEAPFDEVRMVMKRLNERIDKAKGPGGEPLGDLFQIKRGGEFAKLKEANTAFKRELLHEQVSEIIAKNIRGLEGRMEPDAHNISAGRAKDQILKLMADDPNLADATPKPIRDRIVSGLEHLRTLPLFGAPKGVDAGSKNMFKKAVFSSGIGGVAGEFAGRHLGLPPGIGGAVGTLTAWQIGDIVAGSLAKPGGVKWVEGLAKATNGINETTARALVIFNQAEQFKQMLPEVLKSNEFSINDKLLASSMSFVQQKVAEGMKKQIAEQAK